jgi:hypothetical protein
MITKLRAIVALLALTIVVSYPALVTAQAAPSLLTDQPLYHAQRDKQVILQGGGLVARRSYMVWIQTPSDNSTHSTGLSFVATDRGEIPPGISLPIQPNSPLGTYLVSVSDSSQSDSAIARAHYGIWGTDKYVYQRTEVVQAKGGGILPKASLKATIRNPAAAFVYDSTVAADDTGGFIATWKIPPDAILESYTMFIDGVGTYDYPDKEFVSISKFSVTPAVLNITVFTQPAGSYERMQTALVEFAVRYPDSASVTSLRDGLKPAAFYAGQSKIADLSLASSGVTSGIWSAQFKVPRNATLDVKYKFMVPAKAFDDGNGNTGPGNDIETSSFSVFPATLKVTADFNSTHFQVPFDTMTSYVQVGYPDGTFITNATVWASLNAANSKVNATVNYDRAAAIWIVRYSFSWGDLLKLGTWTLTVGARDAYGNAGSGSFDVTAEPYVLLEIIFGVVIVLVVARWLLAKYWRRLYLGAKRILSTFRERLSPPSLGHYFKDSPVTP